MNGVERIARKLCQEDGFDPDTRVFHEFGQPCSRGPNGFLQEPHVTVAAWETYAAMASRTLSAIREPSDVLKDAGWSALLRFEPGWSDGMVTAKAVWQAMLDVLLKGEGS